jgi:hypothetical protein
VNLNEENKAEESLLRIVDQSTLLDPDFLTLEIIYSIKPPEKMF